MIKVYVSRDAGEDLRELRATIEMLQTLPWNPKIYLVGSRQFEWELAAALRLAGIIPVDLESDGLTGSDQ